MSRNITITRMLRTRFALRRLVSDNKLFTPLEAQVLRLAASILEEKLSPNNPNDWQDN